MSQGANLKLNIQWTIRSETSIIKIDGTFKDYNIHNEVIIIAKREKRFVQNLFC